MTSQNSPTPTSSPDRPDNVLPHNDLNLDKIRAYLQVCYSRNQYPSLGERERLARMCKVRVEYVNHFYLEARHEDESLVSQGKGKKRVRKAAPAPPEELLAPVAPKRLKLIPVLKEEDIPRLEKAKGAESEPSEPKEEKSTGLLGGVMEYVIIMPPTYASRPLKNLELTPNQVGKLQLEFQKNQNPTLPEKIIIADRVGVPRHIVTAWYQTTRKSNPTVKRPVGRPRKTPSGAPRAPRAPEVPRAKRGRGRPRKSTKRAQEQEQSAQRVNVEQLEVTEEVADEEMEEEDEEEAEEAELEPKTSGFIGGLSSFFSGIFNSPK